MRSANPRKIVPREYSRAVTLSSIAAVLAVVSGIALLTTAGHDLLPPIMTGHYTPIMIFVVGARADRALLRQVLVNLLGNAIKFNARTPAAEIEVGCLRQRAGVRGSNKITPCFV